MAVPPDIAPEERFHRQELPSSHPNKTKLKRYRGTQFSANYRVMLTRKTEDLGSDMEFSSDAQNFEITVRGPLHLIPMYFFSFCTN
jgi:hypothetical protein